MPTIMSESLSIERALELQAQSRQRGDLLTWAIYRSPSDFPGRMVARPHSARHNSPLLCHIEADDIETLRGMLPPGLFRLDRAPSDDPVIVETWI